MLLSLTLDGTSRGTTAIVVLSLSQYRLFTGCHLYHLALTAQLGTMVD